MRAETSPRFLTVFGVLFEIVSAYGTVGLSLGYDGKVTSLAGEFGIVSKLVLICVMLAGRHRGLPYAVDSAVYLPSLLNTVAPRAEPPDIAQMSLAMLSTARSATHRHLPTFGSLRDVFAGHGRSGDGAGTGLPGGAGSNSGGGHPPSASRPGTPSGKGSPAPATPGLAGVLSGLGSFRIVQRGTPAATSRRSSGLSHATPSALGLAAPSRPTSSTTQAAGDSHQPAAGEAAAAAAAVGVLDSSRGATPRGVGQTAAAAVRFSPADRSPRGGGVVHPSRPPLTVVLAASGSSMESAADAAGGQPGGGGDTSATTAPAASR